MQKAAMVRLRTVEDLIQSVFGLDFSAKHSVV